MKPAKTDWSYVARHLFRPGITFAVAAILMGAAAWFHARQASLYEIYSSNHEAIHEDYDALIYRRRLIERYYNRYRELQALGFQMFQGNALFFQKTAVTNQQRNIAQIGQQTAPGMACERF